MSNFKTLAIGATMAVACVGAFAQAASAPATPRIDKREVRQEKRIEQGVASGQLTAKETLKLEKEQAAIQKTEARAKSDGKVTKTERKRLTKMQNKASQDIYQQKHDAQTATKP
jgi:DNA repair exonuclease SbcCD nuclease subunit